MPTLLVFLEVDDVDHGSLHRSERNSSDRSG